MENEYFHFNDSLRTNTQALTHTNKHTITKWNKTKQDQKRTMKNTHCHIGSCRPLDSVPRTWDVGVQTIHCSDSQASDMPA